MAVSGVSQIENGHRNPNSATLIKLARALNVEVADLFPKGQAPLPLDDTPSLEELHDEAGCATDWLVCSKDRWEPTWRGISPEDAMRTVREMQAEFATLKPLMAEQEKRLPETKRSVNGPYKQAWVRFITGCQVAHDCCVANDIISVSDTLNDAAKELGEAPGEPLEGLLVARAS